MFSEIISVKASKFQVYSTLIGEEEVREFPSYPTCPVCDARDSNVDVVEIGGEGWRDVVTLVQCGNCSHIYYRNPPSMEFVSKYYKEQWMLEADSYKTDAQFRARPTPKLANLAEDLGTIRKEAAIIDVGCGSGRALLGLDLAGFNNVYGCELSEQRATIAAQQLADRIFNEGYRGVPDDLRFDVICTNQVAEHLYDPGDFFAWAADRLNADGFIVVDVPNAEFEPTIVQALFLPHLQSFTTKSLKALGERFGFSAAFWVGERPSDLCCVFSKNPDLMSSLDRSKFLRFEELPRRDDAEMRRRIQFPWREDGDSETITVTYMLPALHRDPETLWRSYVRLDGVKGFILRTVWQLSYGLQRIGLERLSVRSRLLLKLVSRRGNEVKTVGYMQIKNRPSDSPVPRVGHRDQALFLMK